MTTGVPDRKVAAGRQTTYRRDQNHNKNFTDFFGLSDRQFRTCILSLKEKRFVTVFIQNKNERVIWTTEKDRRVPDNELRTLERLDDEIGGLSNQLGPFVMTPQNRTPA